MIGALIFRLGAVVIQVILMLVGLIAFLFDTIRFGVKAISNLIGRSFQHARPTT